MRCIAIILAGFACASCGSEEPDSPKDRLIEEAREAVRSALKDPQSAQFEINETFVFPDDGLLCQSEVNAKNSFGGYTGFQGFAYERGTGVAFVDSDFEGWHRMNERCVEALELITAKTLEEARAISGD